MWRGPPSPLEWLAFPTSATTRNLHRRYPMFSMTRRTLLGSAAAAAAFGLAGKLEFTRPALAGLLVEPTVGFYK